MSEDLLNILIRKRKLSTKGASFSLFASMITMALWGWTPLKNVIPALLVVIIFLVFLVFSVALTINSIHRSMQVTAMKAKIADS